MKNLIKKRNEGFTLIEILFVIGIIGILSTIVLASINDARLKGNDTKRLSDMRQIQTALYMYYDDHNGNFPQENSSNGNWEDSTEDGGDFIDFLKDNGYMSMVPVDPINSGTHYYSYYVYPAESYGCDASKGEFYVLGVRDMEGSPRPHRDSPGWSCPGGNGKNPRNWQNEFDWVTGKFEEKPF